MKHLLIASISFALAAPAVALAKDNIEAGKAKAAQVCATCHSADGSKPVAPDQPILAGQHYDYLVRALSDYKAGRRNNAIMKGFAEPLSRQDIRDLAAWFASQRASSRANAAATPRG
jgi:cytochrome c553